MINKSLVSIIIPCYNAEKYIVDTINSVLNQTYAPLEIITINDGSTDKTEVEIQQFLNRGVKFFKKENTGVSDTRNLGFKEATGNFILFLDSDDLLTPDFIEKRVELLAKNSSADFCCGKVIKINDNNETLPGEFRGTFDNIFEEVLLYDQIVITCPSNYLFRKSFLNKFNLEFDNRLFSTADRLFLIEVGSYGKGEYIQNGGELLYRVSNNSMSHKLSVGLVDDNVKFSELMFEKRIIPDKIMDEFKFKINYILGAAYLRLKDYRKSKRFLWKAIYANPSKFIENIFKMFT